MENNQPPQQPKINTLKDAERLTEARIRAEMQRGGFDNLPGAGKPIPDIDSSYQPTWWVKNKLASEQIKLTKEQAEAILRIDKD